MNSNDNRLYEQFHKSTSTQSTIISYNNFTYKQILNTVNKYLGDSKKEILDIGCGAGTLCFYYADKGHIVHGIDISRKAIAECKKSAIELGLDDRVMFNVMQFPNELLDKKYDFIIFTEVIEHLEDDRLALEKINKLLKKNGMVFLSTPSKNAPLHKLGYAKGFDKRVGHLRRYTSDELVKMFETTGFELIEVKKTEGILRNFLYLNPHAGQIIRIIKFFLVDLAFFIDNLSMKLFGESNIFIIAKKIK